MSIRSTFKCFGLVIHGYGWEDIRRVCEERSIYGESTWIVTANPEILMHARQDARYWDTLRQADMRVVDGFGLQCAGWVSGALPKRISGVETAEKMVAWAEEQGWTVALVGGGAGVADRAAWTLRARFPRVRILAEEGGRVDRDGRGDARTEAALQRVIHSGAEVVFVAFGHPKQEAWIQRVRQECSRTKIFIGVGGTFDFWAGEVERAPQWTRTIGMEWFWRLVVQPVRWRRILVAVVFFPLAVAFERVQDVARLMVKKGQG